MSLRYICDACGKPIPREGETPCEAGGTEPIVTVGIVDVKHYCSAMQKKINAFERARDEAHDEAVARFEAGMVEARKLLTDAQ